MTETAVQRAIVTGASTGIGAVYARKQAERITDDASIAFLVNNAGVSTQGNVLQNSLADPEALIAVNITAPTLLSIAAAKAFAAVANESVWAAYEATRQVLRGSLTAGQPAPRYRQPAATT
jgi:short-subunit dehydrogenase